jgi:hypothetical protein
MRIRSRLLIGALGSLAAFTWLATANDVSAGQRWWQRVQFLASDKMEGRLTGTEGYRRAAEYVAGEFHNMDLRRLARRAIFNRLSLTCRE